MTLQPDFADDPAELIATIKNNFVPLDQMRNGRVSRSTVVRCIAVLESVIALLDSLVVEIIPIEDQDLAKGVSEQIRADASALVSEMRQMLLDRGLVHHRLGQMADQFCEVILNSHYRCTLSDQAIATKFSDATMLGAL